MVTANPRPSGAKRGSSAPSITSSSVISHHRGAEFRRRSGAIARGWRMLSFPVRAPLRYWDGWALAAADIAELEEAFIRTRSFTWRCRELSENACLAALVGGQRKPSPPNRRQATGRAVALARFAARIAELGNVMKPALLNGCSQHRTTADAAANLGLCRAGNTRMTSA